MEKTFGAFFQVVGGNEGSKCHYPTRLDTYGCGCSHDCKYCYAKSLLSFRKLWHPEAPAVASMQYVRDAIRKIPPGAVVRLGGMTDCFQPIEKTRRATYQTIQRLNRAGVQYLIVTKSAIIADPEYLAILDPALAHIQITVTTLNDELSKTYEKASPPSERVAAIKKLQEMGFDVQLRLSPFIPEYIDTERLNMLGVKKILVEFLRVNAWIEKWFDIDYTDYTVKQGGYRHLPLAKKKEYISRLKGFEEITVCEDEDEAYAYWRDHFNHNPDDCCNLRRTEQNGSCSKENR